ncbi:MAG TPA: hypothetical protein VF035_07840 [Longimicrobiales bacterium]
MRDVFAAGLRRPIVGVVAVLLSVSSFTIGRAQVTPPLLRRTHADTVFFQGDTIILHAAAPAARLTDEFARYIAAMPPLPGIAPHPQPRIINIYLAENEAAFGALTGGAAPHWGAGVAQPDSGIIVLPAYSSDRAPLQNLGPVVRHELAHVELQHALGPVRIPRWFTEGYAVMAAGQLDPDAAWYLRLAFLTERAPPLDSLELGWPAAEAHARVAYLLSGTAVAYLHSLGDDRAFREFLAAWREQGSFEAALRGTYRISSATFEQLWTQHVRKQYGWLLFVAQGVVASLVMTVMVVILIFMRRRRDRRRLAELKRNEVPDSPAYWLGEQLIEPQPGEEDGAPDAGGADQPGRVDDDRPL